jgi:antitoxin component YwqK of YwqJK toxin-antitoxin module
MGRRYSVRVAAGVRVADVLVAASCLLAACATPGTTCPDGTTLARRIYSGGAEAEWCRRPDGARQGPERRYYESGAELASGEYVDGAQSGVWRYRFNNGRNWRAERWEDGALVQTTIDPAIAHMNPDELAALGPTTSGIIKLASHDPLSGSATRDTPGATFVSRFPNGRPQTAGSYDALGLRTGIWRFWFEDGRPARELEFLGGVREHAVREWHPNGTQAAEGFYVAGLRDGRWRFWDQRGQLTAEAVYRDGTRVSAPATGDMLPHEP